MGKRFPYPIPRGWYQVAYSDELSIGDVEHLHYFGRELIAFRTESGKAHVVDCYCPHLGANLGEGGFVDGELLRCPFHHWAYDGSGVCVDVPYAKRIPKGAGVGVWPSAERNGMLMVWFDPAGEPPLWEVKGLAEYNAVGWSPYWRHRMQVKTCNQEILENVADRAHFHYVHGTVNVPTTILTMEGSCLRAEQVTKLRTPHGIVDGGIVSNYQGLGFGNARFTGICEALLVLATTPVHEELIDVRFSLTVDESSGASTEQGVGRAIVTDIIHQFEEDTPIWENKQFQVKPLLCDGDGEIAKYRRWASQFY